MWEVPGFLPPTFVGARELARGFLPPPTALLEPFLPCPLIGSVPKIAIATVIVGKGNEEREHRLTMLTLVGQIKLLHAGHMHFEVAAVAEEWLTIADCAVRLICA